MNHSLGCITHIYCTHEEVKQYNDFKGNRNQQQQNSKYISELEAGALLADQNNLFLVWIHIFKCPSPYVTKGSGQKSKFILQLLWAFIKTQTPHTIYIGTE